MIKIRVVLFALIAAFFSIAVCAFADFGGKFPGKGDYLKWQEANMQFSEGTIFYNSGQYDKAIQKYKAAIEIYPDDHEYYNNLGLSYKKKGEFGPAEEALRKAITLNPAVWDSWSNLGSVLKHQGRAAEAKDAYSKALTLNPPAKSRALLQLNLSSLSAAAVKAPAVAPAQTPPPVTPASPSASRAATGGDGESKAAASGQPAAEKK